MKITQEVRNYANGLEKEGIDISDANAIEVKMIDIEAGMRAKSEEFKASGAEIYQQVNATKDVV